LIRERYVLIWRTMDHDTLLPDLALFAQVVAARGISAAATRYGLSKSWISTRMTRLEGVVGTRLLIRSRLGVRPTSAGERLLAAGQRLLRDAEAAVTDVRTGERTVAGEVRVSCPSVIVDALIVPILAGLLRKHPGLTLDVSATDRIVDPRQEAIDVAFRFGWLHGAESGLVAQKVGIFPGVLCASPSFLKSCGKPIEVPSQLKEVDWIGYAGFGGQSQVLSLSDQQGRKHPIDLACRIRTTSAVQVKDWVLHGLGVSRLPKFLVQAELVSGSLVQILPEFRFDEPSLFAIYARDRLRPMRIRVLLNHLKSAKIPSAR
jgi:DNA-binding transcriptional LysR family regulator